MEDEPLLNITIEEHVALLEVQVRISSRKVLFLRIKKHCFDLQRTVYVFKRSVPSSLLADPDKLIKPPKKVKMFGSHNDKKNEGFK